MKEFIENNENEFFNHNEEIKENDYELMDTYFEKVSKTLYLDNKAIKELSELYHFVVVDERLENFVKLREYPFAFFFTDTKTKFVMKTDIDETSYYVFSDSIDEIGFEAFKEYSQGLEKGRNAIQQKIKFYTDKIILLNGRISELITHKLKLKKTVLNLTEKIRNDHFSTFILSRAKLNLLEYNKTTDLLNRKLFATQHKKLDKEPYEFFKKYLILSVGKKRANEILDNMKFLKDDYFEIRGYISLIWTLNYYLKLNKESENQNDKYKSLELFTNNLDLLNATAVVSTDEEEIARVKNNFSFIINGFYFNHLHYLDPNKIGFTYDFSKPKERPSIRTSMD